MTHSNRQSHRARSLPARIVALAAALLTLGLFVASSASAGYEQTGIFAGSLTAPAEPGVFPEEVQLGGVGGMAVNTGGAGGVPAGTVYAAVKGPPGEPVAVARFTPTGEGLKFSLGWEVSLAGAPEPYERCGPDAEEPLHPQCPRRPSNGPGAVDVEVDQVTGNVYVLNAHLTKPGSPWITEYSPDGAEIIARFGEAASQGKTTAETPGLIHGSGRGGIAVNDAGEVYVHDVDSAHYHRLMVFRPQTPGDYEHYVYAGQEHDIATGFLGENVSPERPVLDAAGNIYVTDEVHIQKYDLASPANPACDFRLATGGIVALTVHPVTGEPFYYSYKNKKLHQLSACAAGEFTEKREFARTLAANRGDIFALALDPKRQIGTRPPGVLYGGAPEDIGEFGKGPIGYIFAQANEDPPKVEAESVSRVTPTTATLEAQINPKGQATRYAFQYITDAAYQANEPSDRFAGATEAPTGGAVLGGNGQVAIPAAVAISGISPDTEYHYRAVANSHCSAEDEEKVCTGEGADQAFRTFPIQAPGLPDERAYELVSPADKHGGEVFPADARIDTCPRAECKPGYSSQHFPMQSSPGGEAVAYEGYPFSFSEGAILENQYIARRDANTGWQTTILSPALAGKGKPQGYKAFDPGLTRGVLSQIEPSLTPSAPSEFANLYAQPTDSPLTLSALLGVAPPNRLAGGAAAERLRLAYAGASADLSRVFFEANDALTEETPLAPEAVDGGAEKNNLYEWSGGQLRLVNVAPGNVATAPGAQFGSGTLLKSGNPNGRASIVTHAISVDGSRAFWSDESGQLYVREDGESTKAIPGPGLFLSAAADGSKVLLSSGQIYDLEAKTTTDLTQGEGGFKGIAGQSEDLSRIYFVDTAVLDETPNEQGAVAKAGQNNLYVYAWQEGDSRFVATLAVNDSQPVGEAGDGDWTFSPKTRTAEASPGGRFLAFLSQAPLSGYDNTGPCALINSGSGKYDPAPGPCPEAFLYDSATGKLTCASCNPSGERPLGRSVLRLIQDADDSTPQPRYLTDSGRLYFDSRDSLTPTDTNNGVEDVYQYEPNGVGSCKRQDGCVSLISAGHEPLDSNFLAMDEDGSDVFFTTRDQLVLKDKDELVDLYDARVGGGIPSETEVARGECQGEACQQPVSAPNDPTPGSSTFEGAGNVDEKTASKKHAKKHKKKHAKKHKSNKRAHGRAANDNRRGAK